MNIFEQAISQVKEALALWIEEYGDGDEICVKEVGHYLCEEDLWCSDDILGSGSYHCVCEYGYWYRGSCKLVFIPFEGDKVLKFSINQNPIEPKIYQKAKELGIERYFACSGDLTEFSIGDHIFAYYFQEKVEETCMADEAMREEVYEYFPEYTENEEEFLSIEEIALDTWPDIDVLFKFLRDLDLLPDIHGGNWRIHHGIPVIIDYEGYNN